MFLTTYNGTYTKLVFIGLTVVWKKCLVFFPSLKDRRYCSIITFYIFKHVVLYLHTKCFLDQCSFL